MMGYEIVPIVLLTLLFLYVFARPIGYLFRIILRGAGYSVLVFIINLITAPVGFSLGVNAVTALTFGILGIYGVGAGYLAGLLYSLRL